MFKPNVVKFFSVLALILSIGGALLGVFTVILLSDIAGYREYLAIASWVLLSFASYYAFKLSFYKLSDEEYKKVGLRVYLIIGLFILFITIGLFLGIILAVYLVASLRGMKKDFDEWEFTEPVEETAIPEVNANTPIEEDQK